MADAATSAWHDRAERHKPRPGRAKTLSPEHAATLRELTRIRDLIKHDPSAHDGLDDAAFAETMGYGYDACVCFPHDPDRDGPGLCHRAKEVLTKLHAGGVETKLVWPESGEADKCWALLRTPVYKLARVRATARHEASSESVGGRLRGFAATSWTVRGSDCAGASAATPRTRPLRRRRGRGLCGDAADAATTVRVAAVCHVWAG